MPGSDYIINCIEVSGTETVAVDYRIPKKYGIDQCIGDTIGPGGIFKALRTVPSWLAILRDVEDLCPNALVLNYTNPMSMMTLAAVRSTSAPVVGLCHSVQGTSQETGALCRRAVRRDGVGAARGINHMAWFTELEHNGKDLYPRLAKRARTDEGDLRAGPGALRHDVPLRLLRDRVQRPLQRIRPLLPQAPRPHQEVHARALPRRAGLLLDELAQVAQRVRRAPREGPQECRRHAARAQRTSTPQASSRLTGSAASVNLRLGRSTPASSPTSPAPASSRSKCSSTTTASTPATSASLPPQVAALCVANMAVFECAVSGILNHDKDAVYHAMMLDPLSAAVLLARRNREDDRRNGETRSGLHPEVHDEENCATIGARVGRRYRQCMRKPPVRPAVFVFPGAWRPCAGDCGLDKCASVRYSLSFGPGKSRGVI